MQVPNSFNENSHKLCYDLLVFLMETKKKKNEINKTNTKINNN